MMKQLASIGNYQRTNIITIIDRDVSEPMSLIEFLAGRIHCRRGGQKYGRRREKDRQIPRIRHVNGKRRSCKIKDSLEEVGGEDREKKKKVQ